MAENGSWQGKRTCSLVFVSEVLCSTLFSYIIVVCDSVCLFSMSVNFSYDVEVTRSMEKFWGLATGSHVCVDPGTKYLPFTSLIDLSCSRWPTFGPTSSRCGPICSRGCYKHSGASTVYHFIYYYLMNLNFEVRVYALYRFQNLNAFNNNKKVGEHLTVIKKIMSITIT